MTFGSLNPSKSKYSKSFFLAALSFHLESSSNNFKSSLKPFSVSVSELQVSIFEIGKKEGWADECPFQTIEHRKLWNSIS